MIQKRIVYDTFMMLGDVGGLSDILVLITAAFVSVLNEPLFNAKLISKLFMEQPKQAQDRK